MTKDGKPQSKSALRRQAEQKLSRQVERLDALSSQDVKYLVHELGTHQIELEMQNEELRRALEELEASQRRYSELYHFAPAGFFTVDRDCFIREVNARGASLLGFARGKLLNAPFHLFVAEPDRAAVRTHCESVCRTQSGVTVEARLRRKDGTEFPARLQSMVLEDGRNEAVNCMTMVQDITEQKEAEARSAEIIGHVFKGVQHEIGNPVNSINMLLGMLRPKLETMPPEEIAEKLSTMAQQIGRIEKILAAMKSFNLYETQELRRVRLSEFLDNFLPPVRKDCGSRGIDLDVSLDPEAGSVLMDPLVLQRILLQVIANAMEAVAWRKDPKIALGVNRVRGAIRFHVEDNGVGIPAEKIDDVFKPFYTTKEEGGGLGLVIVKQMLARVNGSITIGSTKDVGTAVDITIPGGFGEE